MLTKTFKKIFDIITFNDYEKSNPHSFNGIVETTKYLLLTTLVIVGILTMVTGNYAPLTKLMMVYVAFQIIFRIFRY